MTSHSRGSLSGYAPDPSTRAGSFAVIHRSPVFHGRARQLRRRLAPHASKSVTQRSPVFHARRGESRRRSVSHPPKSVILEPTVSEALDAVRQMARGKTIREKGLFSASGSHRKIGWILLAIVTRAARVQRTATLPLHDVPWKIHPGEDEFTPVHSAKLSGRDLI